ncbi:MTMR5 protein, partial [Pedionomus torquatus]|nr:MTMR5 protein [Pedionomus torquatus]
GSGDGQGQILQRFPEKDWEDNPFPQGIELVSVPSLRTGTPGGCVAGVRGGDTVGQSILSLMGLGCRLSPQPQSHPRNGEGDEEEGEAEPSSPVQPAQLFAPKSLVLVSRLDHAEVFRVS